MSSEKKIFFEKDKGDVKCELCGERERHREADLRTIEKHTFIPASEARLSVIVRIVPKDRSPLAVVFLKKTAFQVEIREIL